MPPQESFEPLRAWARARAAEGVRLEDLLRSFALAHQLGWQLLRRHARGDESEALLELAGWLAEYHDQVAAVVTETYLGERELLVSEVERGAWGLLEELGGGGAAERRPDRARGALRRTPRAPPAAVRGRHGRPPPPPAVRAGGAAALRPPRARGDRRRHGRRRHLVRARARRRGLGGQVLLVIAEPTERARLRVAREEVALLAEHGRRHGLTGRVQTRDHVLEILIAGAPTLTSRLREKVLAPLQGAEHPELAADAPDARGVPLRSHGGEREAPRPPQHARLPPAANRGALGHRSRQSPRPGVRLRCARRGAGRRLTSTPARDGPRANASAHGLVQVHKCPAPSSADSHCAGGGGAPELSARRRGWRLPTRRQLAGRAALGGPPGGKERQDDASSPSTRAARRRSRSPVPRCSPRRR